MTGKWIRLTAALAAMVLAAGPTACGGGDDEGKKDGGAGQPVKVGGIFDLSGETSDVGTPYADGIKGFVQYYNEQGREPEIELMSEDYTYDVDDAQRLYDSLEKEGVVALQGWGTRDTEKLAGDVTADGIPFMSASSADTLTKPSRTPFNFVVATSYAQQMRIALRWISKQASRTKVASFHEEGPFGRSPQNAGAQAAQQLGLGFTRYPMQDPADYVQQVRQARSQGAKYVVIQNTVRPAAELAKQIDEHAPGMEIVCLNWCADELFIEIAGRAAENTVAVMPFAPVSVPAEGLAQPREFLRTRGRTLDQEGLHYVQGWYTMALMAEGITLAHKRNGKRTVDGESIKRALEDMGPFDTGGVSLRVDFTAGSHAGMTGAKLYEVKNERWEPKRP